MIRLIIFTCLATVGSAAISLQFISSAYLPWNYNATPEYDYNKDAVMKTALGLNNKLYVAGSTILHVVTIEDLQDPAVIYSQQFIYGLLTDVAVCGSYVAVTFHNHRILLDGKVYVYRIIEDQVGFRLSLAHEIEVGGYPNTLAFNSACTRLVVTIGGEAGMQDGVFLNPEGQIGILEWSSNDLTDPYTMKLALFTKFNDRADEYTEKGVRWVFRGDDVGHISTFSQDLEPQGIVFNTDQSKAYVMLQENNAVAEVDLANADIVDLLPMGYKNWNQSGFDPSDRDGGVHINPYEINGMYQPAAGAGLIISGAEHIFLINQGAWKSYTSPQFPFDWTETKQGAAFVSEGLVDDSVSDLLRNQLYDDRLLGRLHLSRIDGKTAQGKFDKFYAYGGRDMSLWRIADKQLLYNTGKDIEQGIGNAFPDVFNSDPMDKSKTPSATKDFVSINKGPEPVAFEMGVVDDKLAVFIANSRPGIITILSLSVTGAGIPSLESVHYYGGNDGRSWEQLYEARQSWDVGASDVDYIDGVLSPDGTPLLVVSGRISGSISIYRITSTGSYSTSQPTNKKATLLFDPRFPIQYHYFHTDVGEAVAGMPFVIGGIVIFGLFMIFALTAFGLKKWHDKKQRLLKDKPVNSDENSFSSKEIII